MMSNINSIQHVSIRRTLTTLQNLRFLRTTLAFCTTTLKAHPFQKGTLDTSCEKIYLSSIFVILCLILYLSYSQFACAWSLRFRWFRWFRQFRWFQSFIFVWGPSVPVPWTRSRLPSRDLLDPASSFAGSCSPAIPPCPAGKVRAEDMEYQYIYIYQCFFMFFQYHCFQTKIVESMNPSASISQYQVCVSLNHETWAVDGDCQKHQRDKCVSK